MDEEYANTLWESVKEAQTMQPVYSQLSLQRIMVLGPEDELPTSAKGNVIRSKCDKMFKGNTVSEVPWTHFVEDGDLEADESDSLSFSRPSGGAQARVSAFDIVKQVSGMPLTDPITYGF